MIIKTNILRRAAGMTIYPVILLKKNLSEYQEQQLLAHEMVHYNQQKRWCLYGLGVGLLLWFALYLFVLPVWWNPFRHKWESEAFKKQGFSQEEIDKMLVKSPYYLWSLK